MNPTDEPTESNTRHLLDRHHAGDRDALGRLLERELPAIRELVRRHLGAFLRRRMDTGDMVQDICLHVLAKGPRFVVRDPSCFRRLMSRLVRNRIISAYRAYGPAAEREQPVPAPPRLDLDTAIEPVSPATSPPDRAARGEEREWVTLGLLLMRPLDAEVLRLRDDVDLSFVEIGQRLGRTPDAIRMSYQRALKKLEHCVRQLRIGRLDPLLTELENDAEDGDEEVEPPAASRS